MTEYQLILDLGNSNITLGLFKKEKEKYDLLHSFRLTTPSVTTTDEIGIKIRNLLDCHKIEIKQIKSAAFISVVPSLNRNIIKALKNYFSIEAIEIQHKMFDDFSINYDKKENLGIDRLTNLKSASVLVGLPVVVIDFGTATTIDVLNKEKKYLGGMIMPGLAISLEALIKKTSKLPKIELCEPKKILGNSTKESIQNGSYFLVSHGIDGIIEEIASEYFHGIPFDIVFTGGFSRFITKKSKWKKNILPALTLVGGKILLDKLENV